MSPAVWFSQSIISTVYPSFWISDYNSRNPKIWLWKPAFRILCHIEHKNFNYIYLCQTRYLISFCLQIPITSLDFRQCKWNVGAEDLKKCSFFYFRAFFYVKKLWKSPVHFLFIHKIRSFDIRTHLAMCRETILPENNLSLAVYECTTLQVHHFNVQCNFSIM